MYWKIKLAYLFSTWVQYNSSSSEHIALKLKLFLDIQVINTSIWRYTLVVIVCISHPVFLTFVSSNNFYTLKRFVNHCDKVFPAIWFILYLLQLSESAKMGQGEGEGAGSGKGNENLVRYHNHNVILLTRQCNVDVILLFSPQVWSIIWFLILWFVGFFVAGFCASFYILLIIFLPCFPGVKVRSGNSSVYKSFVKIG